MPAKRLWTPQDDTTIRHRRAERMSLDGIAIVLHVSRSAVIDRARAIGVPPLPPLPRPEPGPATRDPLPAGDPIAWAVLTEGTLLAESAFPYPPLGYAA